jgi:hypothetical protein
MIEAARLAVTLTCGEDEGQVTGMTVAEEPPLDGCGESLGMGRSDEAAADNSHAVFDQADSLIGRAQQR